MSGCLFLTIGVIDYVQLAKQVYMEKSKEEHWKTELIFDGVNIGETFQQSKTFLFDRHEWGRDKRKQLTARLKETLWLANLEVKGQSHDKPQKGNPYIRLSCATSKVKRKEAASAEPPYVLETQFPRYSSIFNQEIRGC